MIKVIMGFKVKSSADLQPLLLKLRSHAMTYPGFVSAENLRSEEDSSIIAMLQTWEELENWRFWETSKIRQSIINEAMSLLLEEPKVTVYRIMPSTSWH